MIYYRFSPFTWPHLRRTAPVMRDLIRIFDSGLTLPQKWETLKSALNQNEARYGNSRFTTYLVLILDGEGITNYTHRDVYEMINDGNIRKAVYAGQTRKKYIRDSHFTDQNSSINKILSRTSMMYYIRRRQFPTLQQAALDEAIMIVSMV